MTTSFAPGTARRSTLLALCCAAAALFGVGAPSSYAALADRQAAHPTAHGAAAEAPSGSAGHRTGPHMGEDASAPGTPAGLRTGSTAGSPAESPAGSAAGSTAGSPAGSAGSSAGTRAVKPPSAAYVETRPFFGTERPDGGPAVTEAQFASFVDREVTPSFPDGLTVQDGWGQWRDSRGAIERERSHELILLYPKGEAARRDGAIDRIRAAYVRAYAQDSVARLDEPARADF